ncbi:ovochymase-2-like isoform X2 [Toxorhynchites rutilus septentrionalis]|uniref:ovochymase-2-like isoform X2 n=1 Tax=Toxorhynchites rutilus septentrionalis TaxID=329112 RepID=UPI0024789C5F|nr:ovochymase-2-like isoform X2 [Toxorhynchites rutilus septentrionalis]
MWYSQFYAVIILGSFSVYGWDEPTLMLPNERSTLDDCHLRFHKLSRYGLASSAFGRPARSREFAHMGAIGWTKEDGTIAWKCVGTLIWPNFVLTAAHCTLDNGNQEPDVVRFGDLNMATTEHDKDAQQLNITAILKHPQYSPKEKYHDIALLELEQNVTLSDYVVPACLWIDEEMRFKILEAGYIKDEMLLKESFKPIGNEECSKVSPSVEDGKLKICAANETMNPCEYETGGPLQIKLMNNARMTPFVVAINSYGAACGKNGPGVHTRVAPYREWIVETLQKNGAMVPNDVYNETFCALRYASYREFEDASIMSRSPDFVTIVNGRNNVGVSTKLPTYIAQLATDEGATDCYGVLIDEMTVVTLAQCVTEDGNPVSHIKYLGNRVMNVSEIHVHPKYEKGKSFNNLAVLRLQHLLEIEDIDPACIWHEEHHPSHEVYVHGSGRTDINSIIWTDRSIQAIDPTVSFLSVRVRFQNTSTCTIPKQYLPLLHDGLTNEFICNGQDLFLVPKSCDLLTGGAIDETVYLAGNNYPMVYGLNYLGRDCGFGEHSIGISITSHIEWLKTVLITNNRKLQSSAIQFVDSDLREGESCEKQDGRVGQCVSVDNCSRAWKHFLSKQTIELCATSSLVCCPLDDIEDTEKTEVRLPDDGCSSLVKNLNRTSFVGSLVFIAFASNVEEFRCLGTIITEKVILTSASCIGDEEPAAVKLMANTTQKMFRVEAMLVHQAYNATDGTNDIAMIRLEDTLVWSSELFPACLWINTTHVPLVLSMVSPVTQESQHGSSTAVRSVDVIKEFGRALSAKVLAMYNSDCQRSHPYEIQETQLCARNPFENFTCNTLSDHLRYDDSNGFSYIVGLAADLVSCKQSRYTVFTRISEYIHWIRTNM